MSKTRNRLASSMLIIVSAIFLIYCAWGATISLETWRYGIWDALFFSVDISDILGYAGVQEMSVGRFGRSGLPISSEFMGLFYVIELLAVLIVPLVVLLKDTFYFCEGCQLPFDQQVVYYSRRNHQRFERIESGSLGELKDEEFLGVEENIKAMAPKTRLSKIDLNRCPKCGDVIVNVSMGITKKDDKNRSEFKGDSDLDKVEGVYIDQPSIDIFYRKETYGKETSLSQ